MTSVRELFLRLPAGRFEATEWGRRYDDDVGLAWVECQRGDWLLWLAGILETSHPLVAQATLDCARFALSLLPDEGDELQLQPVVEVAERWVRGEETAEACAEAAKGILYVYKTDAAPRGGSMAGYATSAVSAAVNVATFTSPLGVACAASAAALAAAQVATPNDETAIRAAHRKCAHIVRARIPFDQLVATHGFEIYAKAVYTTRWRGRAPGLE